jgi:hypothetical protein
MNCRVSQNAEYGTFEAIQQNLADQLGITPREFQAALWVGMGGETGVRNGAPFADIFLGVIDEAARERGVSRNHLLQAIAGGSLAMGALFTPEQFEGLMGQRGVNAFWDDQEDDGDDPLALLGTLFGGSGGY